MSSRRRQRSFSESSSYGGGRSSDRQRNDFHIGDNSSGHSHRSPSIPSLQTALFGARARHSGSSSAAESLATEPSETLDEEAEATTAQDDGVSPISNDQERQILLLLLLAQVCSLHDSTPRTYTVHVLQLFERGILDRESIQFLFELGLVPSIETTERQSLLQDGPVSASATVDSGTGDERMRELESRKLDDGTSAFLETTTTKTSTELALTTTSALSRVQQTTTTTRTHHNLETLRSMEAMAIRRQLSQHDYYQEKKQNGSSPCSPQKHEPSMEETKKAAWEVEHFPLSLSRYQREFTQISLINRGGFGSVYHVVRKMDGCDYAMKEITFDSIGYSNENIQKVVREVQCLAKVSEHPNIVRYYTSWLEPSWMTGGSGGPANGRQNQQLQQLQYDAIHKASPQKLLKDIENILDAPFVIDKEDASIMPSSSSESSCSFSDSEGDSSVSCIRRRNSWDSGVPSTNGANLKSNQGYAFKPWSDPFEMSDASSSPRQGKQRYSHMSKPKTARLKQYKYQVTLFIQMQLCHPATLEDWIRERNRRIPENDHAMHIGPALDIFQQLCGGLAHIHDKNIVHRDLKPANAFASKDGKVIKIGDFGLSKEIQHISKPDSKPSKQWSPQNGIFSENTTETPKETPTKVENGRQLVTRIADSTESALAEYKPHQKADPMTIGIGTASYAAPEQIRSKHYGTPADIFSLGLILLELCCNFETQHEKLHNFQQCRNQKVPSWLDDHYPDIATTILSCTRPNPRDRPTAKELLALSHAKSPKSNLEVQLLKGQLKEKDQLLAEKDRVIENLRMEMERMRAAPLFTNPPSPPDDSQGEVAVEFIASIDEERSQSKGSDF